MEYIAEVKRVSQRKAVSLDNIYQAVFETDDSNILDLGKLPPDTRVKLKVEIDD